MSYNSSMNLHELAEQRSLAYHRAVAARLLTDAAFVERARQRVREWSASGALHPEYAREWESLLARPLAELAAAITDPSEHARALRQTTPFAGVLPPRERWALWREVRRAHDTRR
jgi:hypothetical protein